MTPEIRYHIDNFDVSRLNQNNIDRIQFAMLPARSTVLEIGCATGYMSEYLEQKMACVVTGIELNPAQAAMARSRCSHLIEGDAAEPVTQARVDDHVAIKGKFDIVFMSQVIEHVAYPDQLLVKVRDWLAPDGALVVSTCNVAHWKLRLDHLAGRWEYADYGIMDKTHLRFFTTHSFRRLLKTCGYRIVDEGYSFEDFCPFRLLFDKRILAPSDLLRLIPFVGQKLREKYIYFSRNFIATQFAYKAKLAEMYENESSPK